MSHKLMQKFSQYLWFLSEDFAVVSLFDNNTDEHTEGNIIANSQRESLCNYGKRYIPSSND